MDNRGAGLDVLPDGSLAVGTNVAMSAPLPVGFVEITCRIVAVVDEIGYKTWRRADTLRR